MPIPLTLIDDPRAAQIAHSQGVNAWWQYASEIFDHAGLSYTHEPWLAKDAPAGVAVIAHSVQPTAEQLTNLDDWVSRGSAVLCVGDPGGLASLAGFVRSGDVDHGHVSFRRSEAWTDVPNVALHAVGGVRLATIAKDATSIALWEDGSPTIGVRRVGGGVVITFGADVWQSVVRIQQGYPVTADGMPAADGTAPLDDNILKCEDGLALSLAVDRAMPPGQPPVSPSFRHVWPPEMPAPIFHRPHADMWRSALLQCLWWAADQIGVSLAWINYWPAGIPAVAHMSHDSDLNVDEHGRMALDTFSEAEVPVTWCHVFPGGYSPDVYRAITEAGHEHALHYNAMGDADIAQWGWPFVRAQYAWAQAIAGTEQIVSNKNHYTRWEGWTAFYEWCERLGIEIDESRGPSKQGTVGFTFGTAHVSFPIADAAQRNRRLNVLSLPLHTQDLELASHESVRDVILDAALDQHGVAHFLFHGIHLMRPGTRKACLELAAAARERAMVWWTAAQINRWERDRRLIHVSVSASGKGWQVVAESPAPVSQVGFLLQIAGAPGQLRLAQGSGELDLARRHGRTFVELRADLPPGRSTWFLKASQNPA